MKKLLFLLSVVLVLSKVSKAQVVFNTETIENDSIKFSVCNIGMNLWNPTAPWMGLEYPKGSQLSLVTLNSLWFSGLNTNMDSFASIQLYTQKDKTDYFPGPLNQNGQITQSTMNNWNKVWKISATEIANFIAAYSQSNFNINDPQWASIREWPAKNNTYARGNNGVNISADVSALNPNELAPFQDLNGNGNYEPNQGEYPLMKGDQMLWWVYNDVAGVKSESSSPSMGLQVTNLCYIFNNQNFIDKQIFYEIEVHNKSGQDYMQFSFSNNFDGDIGNIFDQVGMDLSNKVTYHYVEKTSNTIAHNPYKLAGYKVPYTGIYYHSVDYPSNSSPLYSSIFYENNYGAKGNLSSSIDLFRYRDGYDKSSQAYRDKCDSSIGSPTKFPFADSGFKMCDCAFRTTDYRSLQSSTPQSFNAGEVMKIKYAILINNEEYNCNNNNPWTNHITTVNTIFNKPLSTNKISVKSSEIEVYPNPSNKDVIIQSQSLELSKINVLLYNNIGQSMPVDIIEQGANRIKLDVSKLADGAYIIHLYSKEIELPSYPIQVMR